MQKINFQQLLLETLMWVRHDKSWSDYRTTTQGIKIDNMTYQYRVKQILQESNYISRSNRSCIDLIFTSQPNLSGLSFIVWKLQQILFEKFSWPRMKQLLDVLSMQTQILLRKPLIILTGKMILKAVTKNK